jgi:hypothetical protein
MKYAFILYTFGIVDIDIFYYTPRQDLTLTKIYTQQNLREYTLGGVLII